MTRNDAWELIGRLLNIIGLFCKRALQKRLYSAKETYKRDLYCRLEMMHENWQTACVSLSHTHTYQGVKDEWERKVRECAEEVEELQDTKSRLEADISVSCRIAF